MFSNLAAMIISSSLAAIPGLPGNVSLGMDVFDFNKNLGENKYETQEFNKESSQVFSLMMLDNYYLPLSNKAGFKVDFSKIDSLIKATNPNGNTLGKPINYNNDTPEFIVATVDNEHITSLYLSYYVPTKTAPFDENDLTLLSNVLASYKRSCSLNPVLASSKNHFAYSGSCQGKKFIMRYYPEKDTVAVVFH